MRSFKNLPLSILFSFLLILVIAFCISGTVVSQNGHSREVEEKYYDELEEQYLMELKSYLTEAGYRNSGVTMTTVIEESGDRSYTVTIHHKLIDRLSKAEKEELAFACGEIMFADEECKFSHNFL